MPSERRRPTLPRPMRIAYTGRSIGSKLRDDIAREFWPSLLRDYARRSPDVEPRELSELATRAAMLAAVYFLEESVQADAVR